MGHEHPSFFELDQLALSADEARLSSLKECAQCLAYISEQQRALPVPAWVRELDKPKRLSLLRRRWRTFLISGALATTALLMAVHHEQRAEHDFEKGAPTVALLIKHGEQVRRWNGKDAVEAGDSLMLEVSAAGFHHICVDSLSGSSSTELYRGELQGERSLLPQSYRVDAEPGPERLRILFGNGCDSWPIDLEIPKRSR